MNRAVPFLPNPHQTARQLGHVGVGGVRDLVGYYGAVPDSQTAGYDNTDRIQRALDDLMAGRYGVLYTPPGVFKHTGVSLALSGDGSVDAHLQGAGRRLSVWQCLNDTDTNLTVSTPSGNARDCTISDMTFASGATALELSRASYNLFRDCTFEFTDDCAVNVLAASNSNTFQNCWWVHNQGEALNNDNGYTMLVGCVVGEDNGHIQNNSVLVMSGCRAFSSASKLTAGTGGPEGMGRALFYNTGNGCLILTGNTLTSNFNFLDMRFSDRVVIVGNHIECVDYFLMLDDQNTDYTGVTVVGNSIRIDDGGSFYGENGSHHLRNSVIADNMIELSGPLYTVTFEDSLLDPQYGNSVHGNKVRRRT